MNNKVNNMNNKGTLSEQVAAMFLATAITGAGAFIAGLQTGHQENEYTPETTPTVEKEDTSEIAHLDLSVLTLNVSTAINNALT